MAEPSTTVVIGSVAGITAFGVATGLHPSLLIAGAAGGWLAMSYQPSLGALNRVTRVVMSALVAAWSTPLGASLLNMPERLHLMYMPIAFGVGLIAFDVLGPGVIGIVKKFFARKDGSNG